MFLKNKKAFTLIELLAVIVILSIIASISTPIILKIIEEANDNANISSTYSIIDSAKLYYTNHIYNSSINFDENGQRDIINEIKISGDKPKSGFVVINNKSNISVGVNYDGKCYLKDFDKTQVTISKDLSKCDSSDVSKPEDVIGIQPDTTHDSTLPSVTCQNPLELGQASQSMIDIITSSSTISKNNNCAGTVDYRYNGPNVNNYILFNNTKWRIIGLVNGYVKIISNDFLGDYQWDSNNINEWETSSLNNYLNKDYFNKLSIEAQQMTQEAKYNLGGITSTNNSIDYIYGMENNQYVYSGRKQFIDNTKITIMYPSDYGYSMSSSCSKVPVYYDSDINCTSEGTWLFKREYEWLLTPIYNLSNCLSYIYIDGYLYNNKSANYSFKVRPTLYLKPNVVISGGQGTELEPYELTLK